MPKARKKKAEVESLLDTATALVRCGAQDGRLMPLSHCEQCARFLRVEPRDAAHAVVECLMITGK